MPQYKTQKIPGKLTSISPFNSNPHTKRNQKTYRKKYQSKQKLSVVVVLGGIQILMCFVTLVAQFIFVKYINYQHFTKFHALTLFGTLVLRLSFAVFFGLSGCFGIWAAHKQSTAAFGITLITAGIAACFCLIFLVESAMSTTYMVSLLDGIPEGSTSGTLLGIKDALNIEVDVGYTSDSSARIISEHDDLRLLLSLFIIQLIACLIQAFVVLIFANEVARNMKRREAKVFNTLHTPRSEESLFQANKYMVNANNPVKLDRI